MHIPDGYLGPNTCLALYAAMAPMWYVASRKVAKSLGQSEISLLSLGAAFVFVLMLFNFPLPGGATGHMAGGVLLAIAIGPWAAFLAMSLTLAVQAAVFGDGGLTTLGANAVSMAFVMSFSGYALYRVFAGRAPSALRRTIASAAAAFTAVNLAALSSAVILGLQPALEQTASGAPLYAPYALSVTLPAVMGAHLLFLGPIEALGTAIAVSCLFRSNEGLIIKRPRAFRYAFTAVLAMALFAPLGAVATGLPWGEGGAAEVTAFIGTIPDGMASLGGLWRGLMPGYLIPGQSPFVSQIASALAGSMVVVVGVYLLAGIRVLRPSR